MSEVWTWAAASAWADQHLDFATRNLLLRFRPTFNWGRDPVELFASNAPRLPWPSVGDCLAWAALNDYPAVTGVAADNPMPVVASLAAVIDMVADGCQLRVQPVDANGDVDPTGDAVLIPARVWLATVMWATKLADRRNTSNGIAGSTELGTAIRVTGRDPDIQSLLVGAWLPGIW